METAPLKVQGSRSSLSGQALPACLGLLGLALLAFGLGRRFLGLLLGWLGRGRDDLERRRVFLDRDLDLAAVDELAEQQFLGERLLDLLLNEAAHRPGAVELVVAARGQPAPRLVVEVDMDVAVGQLKLELEDE